MRGRASEGGHGVHPQRSLDSYFQGDSAWHISWCGNKGSSITPYTHAWARPGCRKVEIAAHISVRLLKSVALFWRRASPKTTSKREQCSAAGFSNIRAAADTGGLWLVAAVVDAASRALISTRQSMPCALCTLAVMLHGMDMSCFVGSLADLASYFSRIRLPLNVCRIHVYFCIFVLFQDAFDGILKLTTAKGYSLGDIVQVQYGCCNRHTKCYTSTHHSSVRLTPSARHVQRLICRVRTCRCLPMFNPLTNFCRQRYGHGTRGGR